MKRSKILSSQDLSDGRCIQQLEDERGQLLYRVCTDGGGTCRYCEDLWMAHIYADQMSIKRAMRPAAALEAQAVPA
jgi:hypothetical protein